MVSAYIALTKPKIIVLLLITAVGGLFLASSGFPDPSLTAAVLVGGSLAAGGANALNHFLDRDIDTKKKSILQFSKQMQTANELDVIIKDVNDNNNLYNNGKQKKDI